MHVDTILYHLQHDKPAEKYCTDEEYTYFGIMLYGRWLMYRQKKYRPDGRRMYRLSDKLATLLGFGDLFTWQMLDRHKIRWGRRYISIQTLKRAYSSADISPLI